MCALSETRCHSEIEVLLRMIAKFMNESLQMTTLVNFAFSPKGVGKPKQF
jgi:hypothetical protein